ncbi:MULTISPECIES: histone deacetylase [unclassified Hahella]|uniref:histone deacetylase family protein n=1 Tax=unclassified Hahella TaxID=2624107 RepID=UPI001C1EB569|nr:MULTISPECIES: histone deacetylase [unclassified Hahella]MBU6954609.1 histone deacetylase [Hahella sp. HN01]MDG9666923.1 histone deacetylase [Hahella sp. CR1]
MAKVPLVYHPEYSPEIPAGHRFPMEKFRLLAEFLRAEGVLTDANLFAPEAATQEDIALAHCADYVRDFRYGELSPKHMRQIGLPWSEGVCTRTFRAVGGTLLTARLALKYGLVAHLAGGTHHAHYDHGSGFCVFNDLAVAARVLVRGGEASRVLIIDCDVHQGDGTARILTDDADIFTCSFHCRQNFPYRKAHSDFDIELDRGSDGRAYMQTMEHWLPYIFDLTQPDFVLYDAGVDVHDDDVLGHLHLKDADIAERDEYVIRQCLERDVPVACVIGGGYDKDRKRLAARHGIMHGVADRLYQEYAL